MVTKNGAIATFGDELAIIGMLSGTAKVSPALTLTARSQFCLVPASCSDVELRPDQTASFLRIGLGQ